MGRAAAQVRKACAGHALRSLALLEHGHPDELCVLRGTRPL